MQEAKSTLNKPVFTGSVIFILIITIFGAAAPETIQTVFGGVQGWLNRSASWLYILSVAVALLFCVVIMFSRYGSIKLGPDHSTPDFSFPSWIAMLFSAGMGIGLLFFGVAEPVMHFLAPPMGDPGSVEAARQAMNITFFHWGLHAWGVYALLALCLAYFSFRHDLPLLPRSIVYPILGKRIFGPLGHAIDIFAVVGTMFGVATSLGFGITQINSGLAYLVGLPESIEVQFALIALITLAATVSVVLGLEGGIKKLSNLNMFLAIGLLLVVILVGPTTLILNSFVQNVGEYFGGIVSKTFNLYSYDPKEEWIGGWTLLYWGWWVSWCPFVGMFIARISRGRTIKEFIASVLFVPAGITFLWMTAFGNTAIDAIMNKGHAAFGEAVSANTSVALFKFFELLPMSSILSVLGVLLVTTFFITSSDSGSLVIDTLTSGGAEEPPVWQRVFWAVAEGVVAATLLYAGGLSSLQTMAITSAFPLMLLLLAAAYCLMKELRKDYALSSVVGEHMGSVQYKQTAVDWRERLEALAKNPTMEEGRSFLTKEVVPAFEELSAEMEKRGLEVQTEFHEKESGLIILKNKVPDFVYAIKLKEYEASTYLDEGSSGKICRAEVFLSQGGRQYEVYGFTQEQIIGDVLQQYEKHLQFLRMTHEEL